MPSAVTFAFEILSKGGVMEAAELDIRIIPIKVYCFECSKEMVLDEYEAFCPVCGSPSLQIIEGRDEMRIAELLVE